MAVRKMRDIKKKKKKKRFGDFWPLFGNSLGCLGVVQPSFDGNPTNSGDLEKVSLNLKKNLQF
jgi:hypothetical protein